MLAILVMSSADAAAPASPDRGEESAMRPAPALDSNTMRAVGERGAGDEPDDRSRLTLALANLSLQPQTLSRHARSKSDLSHLAEHSTDADVRAAAAYFLVRSDDAYVVDPDYARVAAGYKSVAARFPGHFFGEFAMVRAMTLELTVLRNGRDALQLAEAWYPCVTDLRNPALRRGALATLATVLIEHQQSPARAREWLDASNYREFKRWDFRWRSQLRAIYLALKTNDRDAARVLVDDFAHQFPRSLRLQLLHDLVDGKVPVP